VYAAGPGTHLSLGGFSLIYTYASYSYSNDGLDTLSNLSLETPNEKDWIILEFGML
jgi:hypothetical protein